MFILQIPRVPCFMHI